MWPSDVQVAEVLDGGNGHFPSTGGGTRCGRLTSRWRRSWTEVTDPFLPLEEAHDAAV